MDDSDGSLIAVSYEARAFGVKRQMRGKEARKTCRDLILIQVPVANNKSNINVYREAGAEVVAVLSRYCDACERSSIDEVYCDVTTAALEEMRFEHESDKNSDVADAAALAAEDGHEKNEAACGGKRGGNQAACGGDVVTLWGRAGGGGGYRVARDVVESTWVAGEDDAASATASKTELRNGLSTVEADAPNRSHGSGAWWGREGHEWTSAERLLAAGATSLSRA